MLAFVRIALLTGCALALPSPVRAQQTVDVGSVSGRVIDSGGGVLPGTTVQATHGATNLVASAVSDEHGRFRLPYLRIGRYTIAASLPGFETYTRQLDVSAGSAFELKVTMDVGGFEIAVIVTSELPLIEAARSQITSTVTAAEVAALPMNGRNFLDIALLAPGVAPTNIASTQLFPETSAVPGMTLSVGSQRNLSNNFVVDGLSANDDAAGLSGITYGVDAIEQFQVITSGAQAELGPRARRLCQRGHQERHQQPARHGLRFLPRRPPERPQCALGNDAADAPVAVRRQRRRPVSEEPHVLLRQPRAARSGADRPGNDPGCQRRRDQCATRRHRLRRPGDRHRHLCQSGRDDQRAGQSSITSSAARDQFSIRYSRYDVNASNARGAGGLSAPTASSNLDNTDQSVAIGNTLVLSSRTVPRNPRASGARRSAGAAVGPDRPGGQHRRRGDVRHQLEQPDRTLQPVVSDRQQPVAPARRTCVARRRRLSLQRRPDHLPALGRGSYTFSSLANFLAGTYNNAGFGQTFGITELAQTNPNLGIYVQDEWKVSSSVTLNAGVRYDLQWLETITTDSNNVSPRLGVAWTPSESRRTIVRASAGLFYDRVPLRALANALMSAGNTTDVTALRQYAVSLSPTQAGAPVFPEHLGAAVPLVTLPNLTTMDRDLQNASSMQSSTRDRTPVRRTHDAWRRLPVSEGSRPADRGQPERADVRGRRHQQRLPAECVVRQQQPVFVGRRLELSRPARVAVAADHQVRTVPRVVHAVDGHEQRRRGIFFVAN